MSVQVVFQIAGLAARLGTQVARQTALRSGDDALAALGARQNIQNAIFIGFNSSALGQLDQGEQINLARTAAETAGGVIVGIAATGAAGILITILLPATATAAAIAGAAVLLTGAGFVGGRIGARVGGQAFDAVAQGATSAIDAVVQSIDAALAGNQLPSELSELAAFADQVVLQSLARQSGLEPIPGSLSPAFEDARLAGIARDIADALQSLPPEDQNSAVFRDALGLVEFVQREGLHGIQASLGNPTLIARNGLLRPLGASGTPMRNVAIGIRSAGGPVFTVLPVDDPMVKFSDVANLVTALQAKGLKPDFDVGFFIGPEGQFTIDQTAIPGTKFAGTTSIGSLDLFGNPLYKPGTVFIPQNFSTDPFNIGPAADFSPGTVVEDVLSGTDFSGVTGATSTGGGFEIPGGFGPDFDFSVFDTGGFAHGGGFTIGGVGGEDSKLVIFRGSPGEKVAIGSKSFVEGFPLPEALVQRSGLENASVDAAMPFELASVRGEMRQLYAVVLDVNKSIEGRAVAAVRDGARRHPQLMRF